MIFLYLDVIRKDEVKSGLWKIRVLFSVKVYFFNNFLSSNLFIQVQTKQVF